MTMIKEKKNDERMFTDYEVVHDSIEITHFLPPKRCKHCED